MMWGDFLGGVDLFRYETTELMRRKIRQWDFIGVTGEHGEDFFCCSQWERETRRMDEWKYGGMHAWIPEYDIIFCYEERNEH